MQQTTMQQAGRFNLKGLLLLFIGMILDVVSSLLGSIDSGDTGSDLFRFLEYSNGSSSSGALSTFALLLGIAALVLILVGLYQIRHYTPYALRAFKLYLIGVGVAVVAVIIMIILLGNWVFDAALVVMTVGVLAALVVALFAFRAMIYAVADIPGQCGDSALAGKCHSCWRLFFIGFLSVIAVFAIDMILILMAYAYNDPWNDTWYAPLGAIQVFSVLLVIAALVLVAAQILLIVRIWQVYSRYHGGPNGPLANGAVVPGTTTTTGAGTSADTAFTNAPAAVATVATGAPAASDGVTITPPPSRSGSSAGEVPSSLQDYDTSSVVDPAEQGTTANATTPAEESATTEGDTEGPLVARFCYKCGHELADGALFCEKCGTRRKDA